jgi:hypothetical protein
MVVKIAVLGINSTLKKTTVNTKMVIIRSNNVKLFYNKTLYNN